MLRVFCAVLTFFSGIASLRAEALPATTAAWVNQHREIRVAVEPGLAPYASRDEAGGARGLAMDYLKRIGEEKGLRFRPVFFATRDAARAALREHRVDLGAVAVNTDADDAVVLSQPWLRVPCAVYLPSGEKAVRPEELDGRNVATGSLPICGQQLADIAPKVHVRPFASADAAFTALLAKQVDAYVGDVVTSQSAAVRTNQQERVAIAGQLAGVGTSLAFGVRKDWPQLLQILNDGLGHIDGDAERSLRDRWLQGLLPNATAPAASTEVRLPASQADSVRKAQDALPTQPGLSEAQRKDAGETLASALADEQKADELAEQWRGLRSNGLRAAEEIGALEQSLGQDNAASLLTWQTSLPQRATVEQLESLLGNERAALADARSAAAAQQAELAALLERPAPMRDELKAAQAAVDAAGQASPAPAAAPPALAAALRLRQQAAQRLAQIRVAGLEEELRTYEDRLRYASAKVREQQRTAAEHQQKAERLQALVLDRTAASATELAARLRTDATAQEGNPRPLRDAAATNVALGDELVTAVHRLAEVRQLRDADGQSRREAEQALQNTNDRLKIGGISEAVGLILLAERRKLKPAAQLERELAQRQTELAQARMRLVDLREMAGALDDPSIEVQTELRRLAEGADSRQAALRPGLYRLLNTRAEVLPRLIVAQTRLADALGDSEQELRHLAETTAKLRNILDERLLWTPSHPPVGLGWFGDIATGAMEFLRPKRWWATTMRAVNTAVQLPAQSIAALLLLVVLFVLQRRLPPALDSLAEPLRRIRTDRYRYTGRALLLTLVASLPMPLLTWFAARLWLRAAEPGYAFSDAIGTALASMVAPVAAFAFLHWLTFGKGLAALHFRWAQARRDALDSLRRRLAFTLLPAQFIVSVLFFSGESVFADDRISGSLGRAVFVLALGVFAWLGWRALAPGALWAQRVATREPIRLRQFLRLGFAAFTIGLIVLTLFGYYLTAVSLAGRLIESLIAVLVTAVFHGMAIRWLMLGERRLALKRLEERREDEPVRESDEQETRPELAESDAITLASINIQTRRLLRALTVVALVGTLLWVWAEVAPALSYLGNITAWKSSVMIEGKAQDYDVNLRQLLFAGAALMLTWIGTRNLPGLLEIGVLRRLQVDAPTRYAITAVCRYAIAISGSLLGLAWLGLRWSQLQWLAAGLTVGLGFGLQEIFANFVSGLIVLFERPMRVGDIVSIGGIEGTVSRIRTRATTVIDWDNKEVVIPNKTFITEKLTNWTLSDAVTRVVIKLGVAYSSDPEAVRSMLLELARAHAKVLKEPPPNCWCVALASSTLDFELRIFVGSVMDRNAVRNDLHGAILRECRARGIEISFPQTDVWLRNLPQPTPSAADTKDSKRD